MGQIRVKTEILWVKQDQWQFCNFEKTYLNLTKQEYIFDKERRTLDSGLDI